MARGTSMVMAMAAALVALIGVTGGQGGGGGGGDDVVDGVCSGRDQECSKGEEPQGMVSKGKKFQCMVEHGVDYPGDGFNGDLAVFHHVPSFRECCKLCKRDDRCQFWTWATPKRHQAYDCWLKDGSVEDYRVKNEFSSLLVSGYVLRNETVQQASRRAREKELEENNSEPGKNRMARKEADKVISHARGLLQQGRAAEAEAMLRESFKQHSKTGPYYYWLGVFLEAQQKMEEAAAKLKKATERTDLKPFQKAVAHNMMGKIYQHRMKKRTDAEIEYRNSIQVVEKAKLNFLAPYENLGRQLEKDGRAREAQELLAFVANSTNNDGLLLYSMLLLPYVYEDEEDILAWRNQFQTNLKALEQRNLLIKNPIGMEGVPQYYLSYHGRNDASINAAIARLFRKSAPSVAFRAPHTLSYQPPAAGQQIRVGFISLYFRQHSVSKMILGLLKGLPRENFYTVMFQIRDIDSMTTKLASYVTKMVHIRELELASMQRMISEEKLDVLVFSEIGMDPHAYALAFGRQAPVQLAMHGHASTTGVDSIDYYVSYQGFSEPQAQTHYSEKLIVLDGFTPLTRFYEEFPFNVSPAMKTEDGRLQFRSRYNIPPRATVYACLQTIFKVSPKMDFVAKRILNEDPNSIIMFKELPMTDQCGKQVLERMRNKSKLTEDEMARIKFLPAMHDADYSDMFAIVDVILDSYPFGGHTTSMEALAVGRPIVTLPTDFMSGRCTQGFLAFLGLQELIASDLEDFIRIAVKLGKDAALRERISSTIIKGFSALIKDDRSVRGWSQVLEILVRGKQQDLRPFLAQAD